MRTRTFAIRIQNKIWVKGRNVSARCLEVCRRGTSIRTRIEKSRARTPPSLLGIERRMAYANRKYHSGLMWGGVTRGLAGVKLSGSPKRFGANRANEESEIRRTAKPRRSLYEK